MVLHFATCPRKKKSPVLKISYKNIRLALQNPIDYQFLSSELRGLNIDVEDPKEYPGEDFDADTPMQDSTPTEEERVAMLAQWAVTYRRKTHLRTSAFYLYPISHSWSIEVTQGAGTRKGTPGYWTRHRY